MGKEYTAQLIIKQKGTTNKVKIKSKSFSQHAVDDLQTLFVQEMIVDPSYQAREDMLEGLAKAKQEPVSPPPQSEAGL